MYHISHYCNDVHICPAAKDDLLIQDHSYNVMFIAYMRSLYLSIFVHLISWHLNKIGTSGHTLNTTFLINSFQLPFLVEIVQSYYQL